LSSLGHPFLLVVVVAKDKMSLALVIKWLATYDSLDLKPSVTESCAIRGSWLNLTIWPKKLKKLSDPTFRSELGRNLTFWSDLGTFWSE
jgi:hypothetical protein